MTIQQLQALVESSPDLRQLINKVVDYIQANPPGEGGGAATLQEVLTEGSVLTGDNMIDAGGNSLSIGNMTWGEFNAQEDGRNAGLYIDATEGNIVAQFSASDSVDNIVLNLYPTAAYINKTGAGDKEIATIMAVDDFADDAAAAVGGIAVGEQYHTVGTVKVRLA